MRFNKKVLLYSILALAVVCTAFFVFFHHENERDLISDGATVNDKTTETVLSEQSYAVESKDYASYKVKYLDPVTIGSGIGNLNWDRADEIGARFFLDFYQTMCFADPETKYTPFETDSGMEYAVPCEIVEQIVMGYFNDITPEYLQTMFQYDGDSRCYISQFNNSGPDEIATVTDIKEDGQTIVMTYETKYTDPEFEGGSYELGIQKKEDGGFTYTYCHVLSGMAYPASGISANQDTSYPRILYYGGGNENVQVENTGEYTDVIAPGTYKELKTDALLAYDAFFIDANAVDDLQKEWLKIQLQQGFNVFLGYKDVNDLQKISWLTQGAGLNTNAFSGNGFVKLSLTEDAITLEADADMLAVPSNLANLKKAYLYHINGIAQTAAPGEPYQASYDISQRVSDEELTFKGVKLGQSLDDVLQILGGYDEELSNGDAMRSYVKDKMRYVFDWHEGKYCLVGIMLDGYYIEDEFVRGVRIGDSLEDFLAKLPGNDKTPKKWAQQFIYGSQESDTYAYMTYDAVYSGWYNFFIRTENAAVDLLFSRDEKLLNASIHYPYE